MSTQPPDGTELPPELVAKPLSLIGITGLDTVNNAIHKTIWDAFANNRRPDRAPVHFKLLSNAHEFPIIKPKRNSYEWYIPKGILKKNWMNKHLNLIPAVIVVFYDMDWNDPQWNEKIIECASRVQSMRAATEGHSPRLVVVVIQSSAPLPPGEDALGAERAQALCAAAEINSKALFVLPHADHLMGYTIRLENAFYDLAQNYYHHEAKIIKLHRDHLNKTTHQYLFVRHQFKMGFINELKQDNNTAHKHYLHAYNNLLEVKIVDTNALEVKTVAGFINYKLCRLLFALNLPRDAISQLRSHIDRYKNKMGIKELVFEHHAWMSRQHSTFGELFDEAIKGGLPAVQTLHPGYYYQQAAQCAAMRRISCQQLCAGASAYPQPDPLQGNVEFYGQRVWRPGKLSADVADTQREKDAIAALQYLELHHVNHSMIIITLLGGAIAQFKTYRCPRMRRHLLVQMAEEYYSCADYGKALTLLSHMLWDYRREKWWYLVSHILKKALTCSYLLANIQDYVTLCIEALGSNINVVNEDKKRILDNLLAILNNEIPQAEPDTPNSFNVSELWKAAICREPLTIVVDMSTILSCIETKARFTQPKYQVDSPITIELFVRVLAPSPILLDRISVCVNNPRYSCEFAVCEKDSSNQLVFENGNVRKFLCQFMPDPQDVGKDLQIASISLQLGKSSGRHALLQFSGTGGPVQGLYPAIFNYRLNEKTIPDFISIQPMTSAQIIPRDSKMSVVIEQEDPALLGEWYPVTIHITNEESTDAHDVQLSLNYLTFTDTQQENPIEICTEVGQQSPLPLVLSIKSLKPQSKFDKSFYLRSSKVLSATLFLKISYIISSGTNVKSTSYKVMENAVVEDDENSEANNKMACFKEHPIKVTVVKPFEVSSKYLTMKFEEMDRSFLNDPFIIMPQIKVLSPWPLLIEKTSIEMVNKFERLDQNAVSCLEGLVVNENVIANEAICVRGTELSENDTKNLAFYTVHWKRISNKDTVSSDTTTSLSGPVVSKGYVRIECIVPPHGRLCQPLRLVLRLHSTLQSPHSLNLNVEPSDSFIFAGHKQCTLTILPDSSHEVIFNLYPLVCGSVSPPKIQFSPVDEATSPSTPDVIESEITAEYLQQIMDRTLPPHIYIMPQDKEEVPLENTLSTLKVSA